MYFPRMTEGTANKMIHCIFFLGRVNNIRYTPEQFISNQIVMLKQKENEDEIKKSLRDIASELKPTFPVSFTMCVSQPPNSASKYYGVSMSTVGPNPGIIVLAAACLSNNWDDYVAEAVMAYSRTDDKTSWPYGNCAEAESLSNLLKNEQDVKNQTTRESVTYTPQNRQKDRESMRKALDDVLKRTARPTREEQYLKDQDDLRDNAFDIIMKMLDLCNQTPGSKDLVDEILHCIFFLGRVNNIPYTPEKSSLPKRSPFSCVMDMVVKQKGQVNETK
ncbi:hypothetical protein INR49_023746 [Caranx melampygus]|nr:hypothetical protein INR49_023746 [Caranx melampygus]